MYTLIQFNIDDQNEQKLEGSAQEMRRAMRQALAWADAAAIPFHALLIDPAGKVVATA